MTTFAHDERPGGQAPVIFLINPGSTSTKLAIATPKGIVLARETLRHSSAELRQFAGVGDQFPFRAALCAAWFMDRASTCLAVGAMGGLLRPMDGGVYKVNAKMLADARKNLQGEHASNLGCALAHAIGERYAAPAFVVDPVSVDEFEPLAYYSGHPLIRRKSLSHALNIHAAARRAAAELGKEIHRSAFVVAHLGGGISIAPVRNGRIIDVNDAASDGPFSSERTGGLPVQELITLAYSGIYSERELRGMVMGKGGCVAYLGTNSVEEIGGKIERGDSVARDVFDAMAYQVAKEIGAMATVLAGRVDAIILTGGVACSPVIVNEVSARVRFIAPVFVYPGEDEMRSLAEGVARVLCGTEQSKEY